MRERSKSSFVLLTLCVAIVCWMFSWKCQVNAAGNTPLFEYGDIDHNCTVDSAETVNVLRHWKTAKKGGKKTSYKVIFNSNGGKCKTKAKKVTYGKIYGTLPKPSKSGYTFQGWYTKKSGGKKITAKTRVTAASKHKLYAHWKADTKVKLNKTSLTLHTKKTYQLKAVVTGKKGKIRWKSSNSKVVSVNSKGKVTAKKSGTANITVTVNGFKAVCKVTVTNSLASAGKFKNLRGGNYSYKNSKFSFGIGFAESTSYVYMGIWNLSGTSSSYEDFIFKIKEGTYYYRQKGLRSRYIYDITIKPYKDYVKVSLKCRDSSYSYFNITEKTFRRTTNTTCSDYAENTSMA